MAKFLILYRSTATAGDQMAAGSPEQAQEGMQQWMAWSQRTGPALVDLGSPVGNSRLVPAGVTAQTGTPIGGFSVLEASSTDEVSTLLDGHPHLLAPGAAIEVLEYLPIPGM